MAPGVIAANQLAHLGFVALPEYRRIHAKEGLQQPPADHFWLPRSFSFPASSRSFAWRWNCAKDRLADCGDPVDFPRRADSRGLLVVSEADEPVIHEPSYLLRGSRR